MLLKLKVSILYCNVMNSRLKTFHKCMWSLIFSHFKHFSESWKWLSWWSPIWCRMYNRCALWAKYERNQSMDDQNDEMMIDEGHYYNGWLFCQAAMRKHCHKVAEPPLCDAITLHTLAPGELHKDSTWLITNSTGIAGKQFVLKLYFWSRSEKGSFSH